MLFSLFHKKIYPRLAQNKVILYHQLEECESVREAMSWSNNIPTFLNFFLAIV